MLVAQGLTHTGCIHEALDMIEARKKAVSQ